MSRWSLIKLQICGLIPAGNAGRESQKTTFRGLQNIFAKNVKL